MNNKSAPVKAPFFHTLMKGSIMGFIVAVALLPNFDNPDVTIGNITWSMPSFVALVSILSFLAALSFGIFATIKARQIQAAKMSHESDDTSLDAPAAPADTQASELAIPESSNT